MVSKIEKEMHGSPPFPPVIMQRLNLRICQNFVGAEVFLILGDKPRRVVKII